MDASTYLINTLKSVSKRRKRNHDAQVPVCLFLIVGVLGRGAIAVRGRVPQGGEGYVV